jgi:ribosomal protein L34
LNPFSFPDANFAEFHLAIERPGRYYPTTFNNIEHYTKEVTMHYPHKISKRKRAKKIGFRARMRSVGGRKAINRKRREGRKVQVI